PLPVAVWRGNVPTPYPATSPTARPAKPPAPTIATRRLLLRSAPSCTAVMVGDTSADQLMSNKMWGGRFSDKPDAIMEEINASIDVDRHLYAQDIAASKAHAAMLAAQGIITAA